MSESDDDVPDWLTDMDLEILDVLGSNLILSPSIIAENIDRSREGVSNRLSALNAGGMVDKIDRGKYKITAAGLEVTDSKWVHVTTFEEPGDTEIAIKADPEDIESPDDLVGHEISIRRKPEEEENDESNSDTDAK